MFTAVAHKMGEYPPALPRAKKPTRELLEAGVVWGIIFVSVTYLMLSRYVLFRVYPYVRIAGRMIPILHLFLMFEIPFLVEIVLKGRNFSDLGFRLSMPRNPTLTLIGFGIISGIIPLFFGTRLSLPFDYLLLGMITPALSEEWVYRSTIQQKLERALGQSRAWKLGGLLYGLIHIPTDFFGPLWIASAGDPVIASLRLVSQIGFGWTWGILFIKCRSIFPVILSHYLTNYTAGILAHVLSP
jgi:membrane protease YdiL (CAAX protease family)